MNKEGFQGEVKLPDGTWVDLRVLPIIEDNGECHSFVEWVSDITDRKKGEEEIRRQAYFNEALLNAIPTPVFFKDKSGKYQGCNPAFTEMMGVTEEELRDKTVYELWPSELAEMYHSKDLELINHPQHQIYEFDVKDKSGNMRPVIFVRDVYRDHKGEVAGLVGAFLDMSEQERVKKELRSQKDRIAWILEGTNVGTWEWNVRTGEIIINERWAEIIGYKLEEISPTTIETWLKFSHPDDIEQSKKRLEAHFKGEKEFYEHEYREKHKNGEWIWILDRGKVATWTEDGKPEWMYGTHQDITVRKKAEEELLKTTKLLEGILNGIPDVLGVQDNQHKMIRYNAAGYKFVGKKPEEVDGKIKCYQLIGRDIPCEICATTLTYQSRKPEQVEKYIPELNMWLDVRSYPILDEKGNVAMIVEHIRDITDRKRVEDRLKEKNKELENYLYVASHDLRSPLVNIQGFSRRLEKHLAIVDNIFSEIGGESLRYKELEDIIKKKMPRSMEFIYTNVNKMDVLISGLLRISRTGRVIMNLAWIDMNELIKKTVESFSYEIEKYGIELEIDDLPSCYGDREMLSQLFSNIIGNAIKYRSQDRNSFIQMKGIQMAKIVQYKIIDNGEGIEEKNLEKIWNVFFREDRVLSQDGEGIGLSIVKRIVEKHNGVIEVKSKVGEWTEFSVVLPADK